MKEKNIGSSLEHSRIERLCELRIAAIKSVEKIFRQYPCAGDALYLRNMLIKCREENWGSFADEKIPNEEIERKIKEYSEYLKRPAA